MSCFLAEEVQITDRYLIKINLWHLALLLTSEQSSHCFVSDKKKVSLAILGNQEPQQQRKRFSCTHMLKAVIKLLFYYRVRS